MSNITWDQTTKNEWVATMQEHQDADRLVQGSWLTHTNELTMRGCFFGCAMQTEHQPLEKAIEKMKLPPWLVYLSEKIFEGLPPDEAVLFPVKLLKAIPVETDIESVKHEIVILRLTNLICKENGSEINDTIKKVIHLHRNYMTAESVAWSAAWSAALSAAESAAALSAAESAAWLTARSVARSAAESAAESARSAAWSVARSAAESAAESARSAAWLTESNNLIAELEKLGDQP